MLATSIHVIQVSAVESASHKNSIKRLLTVRQVYNGSVRRAFNLQSESLLLGLSLNFPIGIPDRQEPHAGEHGHRHLPNHYKARDRRRRS